MKSEVSLKAAKRNGKQIKLGTKTVLFITKIKKERSRRTGENSLIKTI